MLTGKEIENRIDYHPPSSEAIRRHGAIRTTIYHAMHDFNKTIPDGYEKDEAVKNLEKAMFWANAGIARNHDKL